MNEFIEKLIGRLEEEKKYCSYHPKVRDEAMDKAISIINELAEEYKHCALCYLQSPCEYQNENAQMPMEYWEKGWIPCSERLPETNESVLCWAKSTARGGDVCFVGSCHNGFWFLQSSADTHSFPGQYVIVAWQPIQSYIEKH